MMSSKKVRETVKKLRVALGKTQTEFGTLIGKGIATIQRYETLVAPKGKMLAALDQLAASNGFDEYAEVFRSALNEELGVKELPLPDYKRGALALVSPEPLLDFKGEERVLAAALLLSLRDENYRVERRSLERLLKKPLDVVKKGLNYLETINESLKAAQRLSVEARQLGVQLRAPNPSVQEAFETFGSLLLRHHEKLGKLASTLEDPKLREIVTTIYFYGPERAVPLGLSIETARAFESIIRPDLAPMAVTDLPLAALAADEREARLKEEKPK